MALLALGNLSLDQGDPAAAVAAYERYLQQEDSPITRFSLGTALLGLGDVEGAYTHFQEADRLQPMDPQITYQAGRVATWLGRLDEAAHYLDAAQRLQPENGAINLARAAVAQKGCRPAEAVIEIERAVALAPDNLLLTGILAANYLAANQPEKVDPLLDALQAAPPGDAIGPWMAGTLLAQRGQNAEAVAQLKLALTAPTIVPAIAASTQTALGELYWRDGDAANAAKAFEAALGVDPDFVDAQVGLGVLALQAGDGAAAVGRFDAALGSLAAYGLKYPGDGATILAPIIHLYLALGYGQMGEAAAAKDALQQGAALVQTMLERSPEWPNAHLVQGMFATVTGDTQAAQAAYTHAIACDATYERVREQFVELVKGLETGD
jgi:tetratricopeptide (TPR) repeat protein